MLIESNHRIAGITIRTESDVLIPHIQDGLYKKYKCGTLIPNIRLCILQFDKDSLTLPPLDSYERKGLLRSIGFTKRWLDSPVFCSPEIRKAVRLCLDQPEMAQIELAWNRIIIRNFARDKLDFFYPPVKKKEFGDPVYNARHRNLIAPFLLNYSAALIHGAGVVRNGKAAVFLAPDRGGKTTVMKQLTSGTVLSDDQIVLRQENGLVNTYGTPFGSIGEEPQKAKLGGFYILEKSSSFELIPIKPWDALEFLWNEHRFRWFILPRSLRLRASEILYASCRDVRVFRMRFPGNYIDWGVIDRSMER